MWIPATFLKSQSLAASCFPDRRRTAASCFCLSNHGVLPFALIICVFCVQSESGSQPGILCLFVPSEHHRQLIQLLPEAGELAAAARVLAPSAEAQVRDGTSPRPPRPLPALRPLLLGPGELRADEGGFQKHMIPHSHLKQGLRFLTSMFSFYYLFLSQHWKGAGLNKFTIFLFI